MKSPILNQLGGMLHYSSNVPFKGFSAPTDLVGKSYVFATNVIPPPSFFVCPGTLRHGSTISCTSAVSAHEYHLHLICILLTNMHRQLAAMN